MLDGKPLTYEETMKFIEELTKEPDESNDIADVLNNLLDDSGGRIASEPMTEDEKEEIAEYIKRLKQPRAFGSILDGEPRTHEESIAFLDKALKELKEKENKHSNK